MEKEIILSVKDLKTYYKTDEGIVRAVDSVSFELHRGETLGIVGESGCGKSVTNLSILRLISTPGKIEGGEIYFKGRNILALSENEIRDIRGREISMIFQDPMTSLNPFLRISTQLVETIVLHQQVNKKEAFSLAVESLGMVGIPSPEKRIYDYPHQFSGGMRQRAMIAMALVCKPDILIADEPTTALDVTIQAQILDIMKTLASKLETSIILITHDLGIVAGMCDFVCVMYAGRIVEKASCRELFENPRHPYTKGLIRSVPRPDRGDKGKLYSIPGQPPNMINLPDCCPYFPRCESVMDICREKYPYPEIIGKDRTVSCWLYREQT